jgi:hypothetical protein
MIEGRLPRRLFRNLIGGLMSVVKLVVVLGLSFCLTGCLQSGTLVRIKPDGSGTIEQTMLLNMQTFKGMMSSMGGQMKESGSGPGVMNDADFKRTAERMGVKPVSLTPLKEGGFEGSKAIFAFDDITKVRVDQDPTGPAAGKTAAATTKSPIRFGFSKQGGSSVLTITLDEQQANDAVGKVGAAAGSPQAANAAMDPAMMQMVKTMFQGFRVGVDLEVEGKIVKTNADYVNGSRITLLEVELAGLFEDEAKLKQLQSKVGPGMTLTEMRPYLKDLKGVKINNSSVTVEYR